MSSPTCSAFRRSRRRPSTSRSRSPRCPATGVAGTGTRATRASRCSCASRRSRAARSSLTRSSITRRASCRRRWAISPSRRSTSPTAARTSTPSCASSRAFPGSPRGARRPSQAAQGGTDRHHLRRARAALRDHLARVRRSRPQVCARRRQPLHLVGALAEPARAQHRLAHRLPAGEHGARREGAVDGGAARVRQQRPRPGAGGLRRGAAAVPGRARASDGGPDPAGDGGPDPAALKLPLARPLCPSRRG